MTSTTPRRPRRALVALAAAAALAVAGCGSSTGTSSSPTSTAASSTASTSATAITPGGSAASSPIGAPSSTAASSTGKIGGEVTLVTHDSFAMDKSVLAAFQQRTGITLKLLSQGDAGAMTNQLVLTRNKPLGDVAFGVDNTFASRALDAGVFAPYQSPEASGGSDRFSIDPQHRLTAVDFGDVCVNVDKAWFAAKNLPVPTSYEDLVKPEYKDLFVTPSPATSSPGLAFLLGTIAHFGPDGWQAYWQQLRDNGVKITSGWEDAYTVDFSGSSGKGARPLVLSYASSPPFEVKSGETTASTAALLDTCYRQVEYVGVLAGAANPAGAQAVVDLMLSPAFQRALPDEMYVYPVDRSTPLPAAWKSFAPVAQQPAELDPATVAANRERWIGQWSDLLEG